MRAFLLILCTLLCTNGLIASGGVPKLASSTKNGRFQGLPQAAVIGNRQVRERDTKVQMVATATSVNAAALRAISKLLSTCGLGAVASRKGILDKTAISVLSKMVYNVFQPCLLFVNVMSTVARSGGDSAISVLPLAAAFQIVVGYIVGKVVSYFMYGKEQTDDSKLLMTCTTFGNSGPLPFVFADALFRAHPDPTLAPKAVAYISLYLLGWSPLFWVLATTILSKGAKGSREDQMKALMGRVLSPPVVASLSGLAVGYIPFIRNLLLSPTGILNPLLEAMRTLGNAYLPAVLLVLAGSLVPPPAGPADKPVPAEPKVNGSRTNFFKKAVAVYASRFLLMPSLGFFLIKTAQAKVPFLANTLTDKMLVFVLLLETCMPSAQNSTVILSLNGDSQGASQMARLLVAVYIAGIPAMSFWLAKVMKFTGLF